MCARFKLATPKDELERRFRAEFQFREYLPRYNIAPGQPSAVMTSDRPEAIQPFVFGLRPKWWKEKSRSLVNVRAETLSGKRTFSSLMNSRRCLILADGFYEWKAEGKFKVPYHFTLASGEPFAFAGLWEEDVDEAGKPYRSFAIITTEPNALVGKIHDRMPVLLKPEAERLWLSADPAEALRILKPYPARDMSARAVSRLVNNPTHEGPELILPV